MAMEKEVVLAHAQRPVPCDTCEEDEVPGTYYCIQCKKTLCEDCEKSHKKFTKDHKVILRTQIGEIDAAIMTCADHKCEASFHCEKCNVPVCPECVIGKHQGHRMASLKDVIEKKKECLQGKIDEMQNVVLPKLIRQEVANEMNRDNYNKKIRHLKKDMEDANKVIQQELDRIHHERLESLDDTQLDQLSLFDGRAAEIRMMKDLCQSRVSEYQDAIKKNQLQAINNLLEKNKTFPEVQSRADVPKIPSFEAPNIQKILENFGKLHISSLSLVQNPMIISKFKCPLKGFPRIYITKEGEVWLGGSKSKELVMVNINGKILKRRNIQTEPYMLAVMDCGDVFIIPQNDKYNDIKKLCADGREYQVFDPSPSKSHAISINADQKLLICTVEGKVLKTNGDGTNVEQIYNGSDVDSAKYAIENTDGDIYISDKSHSALLIISKDEKKRISSTITHTVRRRKLSGPIGLVVDKIGNVLCADFEGDYVYIIDQNQKMRELVGRSQGVQFPTYLALDVQNNLWLTQKDGSILAVKYLG